MAPSGTKANGMVFRRADYAALSETFADACEQADRGFAARSVRSPLQAKSVSNRDQASSQAPSKRDLPQVMAQYAPIIQTAADPRLKTFAPLKYIVPGLIVEGLVILAGKP